MTWTRLPPKRKRPKMGVRQSDKIDCPGHRRYVKSLECVCRHHPAIKCDGPMDPHHQRTRGAGGGDDEVVPLCRRHHSLLDSPNWSQKRLEAECKVDFAEIAAGLWRTGKAAQRYRKRREIEEWKKTHDTRAA